MQRHIPLEGATNFRDFGGYETPLGRIPSGRLFRSDRLSELSEADYERISPLGIALVIDLRRSSERASHPTRWTASPAPHLWHAPLFEDNAFGNTLVQLVEENPAARDNPEVTIRHMQNTYRRMITEPTAQRQIRNIFERLAREQAPTLLVHCSGGKDRTGVVAALLQSVLGVNMKDIVEDFMLTARHYDGAALMLERADQILETSSVAMSREALLPVFTVRQDYIEAAFDQVARDYSSTEHYLTQALGVPLEAIDALRAHLTES